MKTEIIAHRGSRGTRPENTLEAFLEALRVGSDGIELDVHLSQDREVVVIHDESTERTTNFSGMVGEMTLAELKRLDAGSWFDKNYSFCQIPTLNEVLNLLDEHEFTGIVNIEFKTDRIAYDGIVAKVYHLVKEKERRYSIVYSSFYYPTLIELKELDEDSPVALLFKKEGEEQMLLANRYIVEGWHPDKQWAKKRLLAGFVSNLPLRVWTVNDAIDIRFFIEKKVSAVMTDYPEKGIAIRQQLELEGRI